MKNYYLSFASQIGFLGACFVEAPDQGSACRKVYELNLIDHDDERLGTIEAAVVEVTSGWDFDWRAHMNRLLSLEELRTIGVKPVYAFGPKRGQEPKKEMVN